MRLFDFKIKTAENRKLPQKIPTAAKKITDHMWGLKESLTLRVTILKFGGRS
jgi:hypothetical protein